MGVQLMAQRILIGAMLGERTNPVHIALTGVLPQALVVAVYAVATALDADWSPVELLTVNIVCTGSGAAGPGPRARAGARDAVRTAWTRRTCTGWPGVRTSAASARSTGWRSTGCWSARSSATPSSVSTRWRSRSAG